MQEMEHILAGGGHLLAICKQTCIPLRKTMAVASTAFQV